MAKNVDAMLSPDIALPPLVEEWVEVYQQTGNDEVSEKASVHELVLFFVRCCGLTANVDEDEAMDVDGVVDTIERLQDESVKVSIFSSASSSLAGDRSIISSDLETQAAEAFPNESRHLHYEPRQDYRPDAIAL